MTFGNKILKFAICITWESTKKYSLEKILFLTKEREIFNKESLKPDLSWIRLSTLDMLSLILFVPFIKRLGLLQVAFVLWSRYCLFCFLLSLRIVRSSLTKQWYNRRGPWRTVALCSNIFQADKHGYDLNESYVTLLKEPRCLKQLWQRLMRE